MRNLFFLLALCSSLSIFANEELTDAIFPRTDPKVVGLIYQMLNVIDIVFTKHDIPYWIDSGTALGAVRHGGLIPWDDDADLIFHIRDERRILALQKEFASYGFHLQKDEILRLYPSKTTHHPYIDIAGFVLCPDNTYRFMLKSLRAHFINFYWYRHEVEPLVRVPFGPLILNAPNEMMRYLITVYGEDCMQYAVYQSHHGGKGKGIKIDKKVKIVDFSPAVYENFL